MAPHTPDLWTTPADGSGAPRLPAFSAPSGPSASSPSRLGRLGRPVSGS
ncbi:hypothetical protein [Streptomyces subrutilus]|nr:hypothetical protein [Streptomyces subrutilus]